MLKTQEILDKLNIEEREQYKDMIAAVNIPDFYKCIAQFSGLQISKVSDNAIFLYLHTLLTLEQRPQQLLEVHCLHPFHL